MPNTNGNCAFKWICCILHSKFFAWVILNKLTKNWFSKKIGLRFNQWTHSIFENQFLQLVLKRTSLFFKTEIPLIRMFVPTQYSIVLKWPNNGGLQKYLECNLVFKMKVSFLSRSDEFRVTRVHSKKRWYLEW